MNTLLAIWTGGAIASVSGYLASISFRAEPAPVSILIVATIGWPIITVAVILRVLTRAVIRKA